MIYETNMDANSVHQFPSRRRLMFKANLKARNKGYEVLITPCSLQSDFYFEAVVQTASK